MHLVLQATLGWLATTGATQDTPKMEEAAAGYPALLAMEVEDLRQAVEGDNHLQEAILLGLVTQETVAMAKGSNLRAKGAVGCLEGNCQL